MTGEWDREKRTGEVSGDMTKEGRVDDRVRRREGRHDRERQGKRQNEEETTGRDRGSDRGRRTNEATLLLARRTVPPTSSGAHEIKILRLALEHHPPARENAICRSSR